jgi:lipopolysaccharide/colanic/teichoic acid biosynthesis glycosyltransferase
MKSEILSDINVNISKKYIFWRYKRIFDLVIGTTLIPLFILSTIFIIFLNYFYNKGSIFYIQKRMGKNCEPFFAIKFRTMVDIDTIARKYSDPLEQDRITKLGRILRKIKIDELPQIINVLKGEMSLIGPRPDYYEHAVLFLNSIGHYRLRHEVRPGISGLSQIRLGYAEGLNATKKKSKIDIFYINNANFALDMKIFFGTILIILKGLSFR